MAVVGRRPFSVGWRPPRALLLLVFIAVSSLIFFQFGKGAVDSIGYASSATAFSPAQVTSAQTRHGKGGPACLVRLDLAAGPASADIRSTGCNAALAAGRQVEVRTWRGRVTEVRAEGGATWMTSDNPTYQRNSLLWFVLLMPVALLLGAMGWWRRHRATASG